MSIPIEQVTEGWGSCKPWFLRKVRTYATNFKEKGFTWIPTQGLNPNTSYQHKDILEEVPMVDPDTCKAIHVGSKVVVDADDLYEIFSSYPHHKTCGHDQYRVMTCNCLKGDFRDKYFLGDD